MQLAAQARRLGAAGRPGRRQAAAGPPQPPLRLARRAVGRPGAGPPRPPGGVGDHRPSDCARPSTALTAVTEPKAVYDDVLPLVVAAYRAWSGEATPIAERPVMRALDLVLHDLDFDAQEGHDLFVAGSEATRQRSRWLDAAGIVNGQQPATFVACTHVPGCGRPSPRAQLIEQGVTGWRRSVSSATRKISSGSISPTSASIRC